MWINDYDFAELKYESREKAVANRDNNWGAGAGFTGNVSREGGFQSPDLKVRESHI